MAKVTFAEDLCKGCGLCVGACPKGILAIAKGKINKKGHSPVEMTDSEKCTAYAFFAPHLSARPCVPTA